MASGLSLEQSHGKPRLTVRVDEVPALPAADAAKAGVRRAALHQPKGQAATTDVVAPAKP